MPARADWRSPEAEQYRRWYKTARWTKLRLAKLREHPLCERHLKQGKVVAATVVHHVNPDKSTVTAFFAGPFESMCAECHDTEGRSEDVHGHSPAVDVDGWPVDPRHPANNVR